MSPASDFPTEPLSAGNSLEVGQHLIFGLLLSLLSLQKLNALRKLATFGIQTDISLGKGLFVHQIILIQIQWSHPLTLQCSLPVLQSLQLIRINGRFCLFAQPRIGQECGIENFLFITKRSCARSHTIRSINAGTVTSIHSASGRERCSADCRRPRPDFLG